MYELNPIYLKDAERFLRIVMILTLLTAGVSKLFSAGGFYDYYAGLFANPDLRINLPMFLVNPFLKLTPFFEIAIAGALAITPIRRAAIVVWWIWFLNIEFGHYVLQEWSAANEIIPYQILGALAYVLPNHDSWLSRN